MRSPLTNLLLIMTPLLATLAPAEEVWGQFYSEPDCKGEKVEMAFSLNNDGCLHKAGASIKYHYGTRTGSPYYNMIVSPPGNKDGGCKCQKSCERFEASRLGGACTNLGEDASYRFYGRHDFKCPENNC